MERILHPDAIRNEEDLERYLSENPDSLLQTVYGETSGKKGKWRLKAPRTTRTNFHQELVNIDQQNPDGTYGQVKDFYRVVTVRQEMREISVQPYNDRVFDSREEAAAWIAADPSLEEIPL